MLQCFIVNIVTCNKTVCFFFKSLEICAPIPIANPLVGIHVVTSDSAFNSFVRTPASLLFCQTQTPTYQFAEEMLFLSALTRDNNKEVIRCEFTILYMSDKIWFKHV